MSQCIEHAYIFLRRGRLQGQDFLNTNFSWVHEPASSWWQNVIILRQILAKML